MGFVSIADAERKAKAAGLRKGMKKGLEEGLKKGIEEGIEKGIKKGIEKSRKNSEKMFKLWVQRVSKKLNVPEKDLLALKP
jgi:flagellar biosynthesis/type III secretory pathway protein FliH